jgi:hypothetical protein
LAKNGSFQCYIYSHENQLRISVFGNFVGREEKQEMWIAKIVTGSLPCQDIIKKAWKQKSNSYIIFKELLKGCNNQDIIKEYKLQKFCRKEKSNNYKPKTTNRLKQRKGLNKHQAEPTIYHSKTN